MNPEAKGNGNLMEYGYADNIFGAIGNGLVDKNRVDVTRNSHVEFLLTERKTSYWLALIMTYTRNPSQLGPPQLTRTY